MADHRRVIFTLTVLGVLGLGLMFFSQRVIKPKVEPKTPDYLTEQVSTLNDIQVQKTSADELLKIISASKSKISLVNLWATWCGPCKEEIPELVKLKKLYKDKDLNVILVSVDGLNLLPEVHKSLSELTVDFLTYIRTDEDKVFIEKMYNGWSGALPATIIFDQNLKVKTAWMGAKSFNEFNAIIKKQLK